MVVGGEQAEWISRKSSSNLIDQLSAVPHFRYLSRQQIANETNLGFLESLESFRPLNRSTTRVALEEDDEIPTVDLTRVYSALVKLNKHKASGPDDLPNWFLRDFAGVSPELIANIMNAFFREQELSLEQ